MKTKTGQKRAGFFVSKILSFARAERERERDLPIAGIRKKVSSTSLTSVIF